MRIEHVSKHHALLKPRRIIFPEERLQHIFPVGNSGDNNIVIAAPVCLQFKIDLLLLQNLRKSA